MQDLADIDIAKKEFFIRNRIKHTPEFDMPGGRACFVVNPLPRLVCENTAHTFTLMSVRSEGQFNSIIYEQEDAYRNTPHRWSVLMNAEDMDARGLKDADTVTIKSDSGVMQDLSVFAFSVPDIAFSVCSGISRVPWVVGIGFSERIRVGDVGKAWSIPAK